MSEAIARLQGRRIFVAGHKGMVGSSIVRRLQKEDCEILTADRHGVDLRNTDAVEAWFKDHRPEMVFLAAAKVGGIYANSTYPVDFLCDNLEIQNNVFRSSWKYGVEKLMFLGSSCIYPRMSPQPIPEDALLTGPLEPTNEWYALAKIAGIKACQAFREQYGCDFISAMPTNLFGPEDNFHPENSHVPAALLQRFHKAKIEGEEQAVVWGTGAPLREFLHVDDLADACVFLMKTYSDPCHVNVGTGKEMSIGEFASTLKRVIGFEGELVFDTSHPDGTPRKLLDVSRLTKLGWTAQIPLEEGLRGYYQWYLEHVVGQK